MKTPNDFKQAIQSYLDERAKTDELFAKSYAKKNKSIDECIAYIAGEAIRNSCNLASNVKGCMMDNDIVYGMAVHYYDEDDIKINKLSPNVKASVSSPASKPVELTEEDKEKARQAAIKRLEEEQHALLKKKALKAKKEVTEVQQMSLF